MCWATKRADWRLFTAAWLYALGVPALGFFYVAGGNGTLAGALTNGLPGGEDLDLDQRAYLDALPVKERLVRYRQLARDTLIQAFAATDPQARADFLSMASSWHALAAELEKTKLSPVPPKGTP